MANYALGVADFPVVGADAMEDYEPPNPTDFKLEGKPASHTNEGNWAESAFMRNHCYGLTGGYEWTEMMNACALDLRQTSKDVPHIMPFPVMMDIFEEIAGRHEDEIEESCRQIYLKSGSEKPSQDRIKQIATIPLGTNPDGQGQVLPATDGVFAPSAGRLLPDGDPPPLGAAVPPLHVGMLSRSEVDREWRAPGGRRGGHAPLGNGLGEDGVDP